MSSFPPADVVVIGAGVIGCSTAYHLARLGIASVAVVEMGQPGSGSTSRSASMLSLQFCADALSLRMARYSYDRYMQFEEEMGVPIDFKRTGWLTLAGADAADRLRAQAALLQSQGVATEVLTPDEVRRRYPLLRVEDLAVATWGPDDGPFDPHAIVWGYVKRAGALGARFYPGVRATSIEVQGGRAVGVHTDHGFIPAAAVVNAAGPWAAEVGRWVGLDIPLRNRVRTILVTGPLPAVPPDHPFVEDLSAEWYFRPEGEGVLMGMGQEPAQAPDDTATRPHVVDAMIEVAAHRVPALADATLLTVWSGVRPLTPDGLPILGPAPGVDGLYLNAGWGGVGIIQAPIAGQLAAEAIVCGRGVTMDLGPFRLGRFAAA
ncbi:MAG: FAD-dependent oxidoreductase [Anaerolineae bacterium]|nr:FAD-dependent oxidoreductase [Anaerolineae bacterium]